MPAADRALRGLTWLMFLVTAMTTKASIRLKPGAARRACGLARCGPCKERRWEPARIMHMGDLLNELVGACPDSARDVALGIGALPRAV